jgi:CheY-like chemotaxis protein
MPKNGPIIVLENDIEEQELLKESFRSIDVTNELKFFDDGDIFLDYLQTTSDKPFIIISAIKLKRMTGLEIKRQIQSNDFLRQKAIPFIFLTLIEDETFVKEAYELTVQGYFTKGYSIEELTTQLGLIVGYWKSCLHPNA